MKLELSEHPKKPLILTGFPGFGLVGSITAEYIVNHLKCREIGKYWMEELPATSAIHEGKMIPPLTVHYCDKFNLIIIKSIVTFPGMEWKIADLVNKVANDLDAYELVCIEGINGAADAEVQEVFYYSQNLKDKKKIEKTGAKPLMEGVLVGVTSALLLKSDRQLISLFVESKAGMPDSKAAAEVIKTLDKYFGFNIDPDPLYETAKKFEEKFNSLIEQTKGAQGEIKRKQMNYVG